MAQVTAVGNGYILYATVNVGATDSAGNQSRLDYDLSLRADSSPSGFVSFSPDPGLTYIILNGAYYTPVAGQRTVTRGNTVSFLSGSVWISHTDAGVGSWSFSGRLEMYETQSDISYMPPVMTTATGTITSTDFVRLPTAPASCTATIVGSNIQVSSGVATSPVTISGYWVQSASDADGYATWSAEQLMTSRSFTYTTLTRGRNYKFRTYAKSSEGTGPSTMSTALFYPAGGKRYDGTSYVATATAKRYDGSAFVQLTTAKRYDGTAWVNLS
jgi:hypothetical protein